jgi:hypothetical protein
MRKKLLLSTAALLAGVAIASAQDMPGGKSGGSAQSGAQSERGSAGATHEQGHAGQAQRGTQDQSKQGQSQQRSQGQQKREQTTGQAQQEQSKQGQSQQHSQAQGKRDRTTGQAQQGQREQSKHGQQGQAQQGQREQGKQGMQGQGMQGQAKQGQAQQRQGQQQHDQTTGQAPQRQQGQQGQAGQQGQTTGQAQQRQQGQTQQGQTQQGQAGGSVNLTAQQRTQVQQTVLASRNVPRANNVNFALSVGTLVPTSVRVVDVAPALIEINPAWRGHQYFVVRDDIIIVDHSRKIVAVVPVGSGGARLGTGGSTALNLSSDQIREVQTVLKERGFDVVADGRMGPRTVEAITAFQRQQGFQVSGRIDNQTISSLGLSNKIGVQGSDTTGRGGASEGQSGASPQAPVQQNQGANKPSTSGQGGANQQQTPAQQNQGANKPSTSGQGGANQQQTPAQQNQPAGQGSK